MRTIASIGLVLGTALAMAGPARTGVADEPGGVGTAAPKLSVKSWIGPAWPGFRAGRVTVIEFWAPWCAPCLAAFPHLNGLVQAMKGEAVDFVSITDEPQTKVQALLAKRPLRTLVALDQAGASFKAYGASIIPHTVIVGPTGKIVAVTRPESVTAEALRAVIAGRDPKLPSVVDIEADLEWDVKAGLKPKDALSLAVILPSPATGGALRPIRAEGRIVSDGTGLMMLVKTAYGAGTDLVRGELPTTSTPLRVSIKAPDGEYDTALGMLRDLLRQTFGITAKWEEVERTVSVLRRTSAPLGLTPARPGEAGGEARTGQIIGKRQPIRHLAEMLGLFTVGSKAVDETGLTELYDFDFQWVPGDQASMNENLAKLGLELIRAPRKVRELVVVKE